MYSRALALYARRKILCAFSLTRTPRSPVPLYPRQSPHAQRMPVEAAEITMSQLLQMQHFGPSVASVVFPGGPSHLSSIRVCQCQCHSRALSHMISLQGFQQLGPWALLIARCGMPQQLSVSVVNRTETEHSWSSSGAENPSWQVDELSLQHCQECLLSTRSETPCLWKLQGPSMPLQVLLASPCL